MPDYTTLCRRQKTLAVQIPHRRADGLLGLLVDSTGIKFLGNGERSGDDTVQDAFIVCRPTGQIMWARVDGEGQDEINLKIGAETFELMV